jgi:glutathione S-transferase
MIKIYHAHNTRSVRIVWLFEELGLPYELKQLEFDPRDLQSEDYLAVHPLGQVPAIDEDGLVLNESGAITQYILAKYGKGRMEPKPGTAGHARYLYWLHFAEATFMPPLAMIAQHAFLLPAETRIPQIVAQSQDKAKRILSLLDRTLQGKQFICGNEFTAADTMLGYNLLLCKLFGLLTDDYPHVTAYYGRLSERPAFRKATGQ